MKMYAIKRWNRILSLILCAMLLMGMIPTSIAGAETEVELVTNLGEQSFVVGAATEFTCTTIANGQVEGNIYGEFTFSEPDAIQEIQYLETQDGQWYTLPGNTFGPAEGFPVVNNATSTFSVLFAQAGTYEVKIALKSVNDDSVVCEKIISVTVAEKPGTSLTTTIADQVYRVGEDTQFTFTTNVVAEDQGKYVIGEFLFSDSSAATVQYLETKDGQWYTLPGNTFGPATGFSLEDGATSTFKVNFSKAGTYTVVANVKLVDGGEVICTTGELTVTVTDEYTVSVSTAPTEGGQVLLSDTAVSGDVAVKLGQSHSFMVKANDGYQIAGILLGEESLEITDNKEMVVTVDADNDVALAVEFVKVYTISISYDQAQGAVTIDGEAAFGDIVVREADDKLVLLATPVENYRVASVVINDETQHFEDHEKIYTTELTADRDYVITVSFAESTYSVTFQDDVNAEFVGVEKEMTADHGEQVQFTVRAKEGYSIVVKVNGEALEAEGGVYTITVKQSCQVTLETADIQKPAMDIQLSNAKDWTQEKTITITASDNGGTVTVYVYFCQEANPNALSEIREAVKNGSLAAVTEPYAVMENGVYYVYAIDAAGIDAMEAVEVSRIDRNVPFIPEDGMIATPNATWSEVTNRFTLSDVSEIVSVRWADNKDGNGAVDCIFSDDEYSFTVNKNGDYYIFVEDEAGNKATYCHHTTEVDDVTPRLLSLSIQEAGWVLEQVTISYTAEDNRPFYAYYSTEYSEDVDHIRKDFAQIQNGSFVVTANATYYVYVVDGAGNYCFETIVVDKIDTTAPEIEAESDADSWTDQSVTISGTVSDNQQTGVQTGSGVEKVLFSTSADRENPQEAVYADGHFTIAIDKETEFVGIYYVWAVDAQGRNSELLEIEVKIDISDPVVDEINASTNTWTDQEVVISGFVSDLLKDGEMEGCGVAHVYYNTTGEYGTDLLEAVLNADGTYTFTVPAEDFDGYYYVWAVDALGHVSASVSVQVRIDTTIPVVDEIVAGTNIWINQEVVVTGSISDLLKDGETEGCGVAHVYYNTTGEYGTDLLEAVLNADGTYTFTVSAEDFDGYYYVWAVDALGHVSEVTYTQIRIDVSIPVVDEIVAGTNAWTNQEVVISGFVSDLLKDGETKGCGVAHVYYNTTGEYGTDLLEAVLNADGTYTFTVPAEDFDGYYYVWAVDALGHVSEVAYTQICIDVTVPENATLILADPNGNNGWFRVDYPTLQIVPPAEIAHTAPITTYYKLWNTTLGETEEAAETMILSATDYPVITGDGVYYLLVWTVEEAGNSSLSQLKQEIKVDISDPKDLTIKINEEAYSIVSNAVVYNKFYQESIRIWLDANMEISGLASLKYQIVAANAAYDEDGEWLNYDAVNGIAVEPDLSFVIYFRAEDNAGNVTIVHSTGIVVDKEAPVGPDQEEAPEIAIFPEEPDSPIVSDDEDAEPVCGIYNDSVLVDIIVTDPKISGEYFSGLQEIVCVISSENLGEMLEIVLLQDAALVEGRENDMVAMAYELIYSWAGQIEIDAAQFNANDVTITVTAKDNAGNEAIFTECVMIDITAPTIDITFDRNDPDSGFYYDGSRVATITVTERNFDPDAVEFIIRNTDRHAAQISGWTYYPGTGNGDNDRYIATVTFYNDGDYTFYVKCTDMAGWTCGNNGDACNNDVRFAEGTVNATSFTIDKTAPEITVTFDNNEVCNDVYFKNDRIVTIVIVEHNFNLERVALRQTVDRGESIPEIVWEHNGDTHIATISYTMDGDYTFDISMTDLAGNSNAAVQYAEETKAPNYFVVDKTFADMIGVKFNAVWVTRDDLIAYNGKVEPHLMFSDINLDSYIVTLIGVQKDKTVDLTEQINKLLAEDSLDDGVLDVTCFDRDLIPILKEFDGVYTLKIETTDKAGNKDTEEIVFTVNRFGSVYMYNEYLLDLIQNGGTFNQEITDNLVIEIYNADCLTDLTVTITLNGNVKEDVKFEIVEGEANDNKVGWYQYTCTLLPENFTADGLYKVTIFTPDETENKSENDPTIAFTKDSTAASIDSVVGLEKPIINAEEVIVQYDVFDAIGLARVEIWVNGELVEEITSFEDNNSFSGQFTMVEQDNAQTVRIIVTDLAGNVTDTASETFVSAFDFNDLVTISTNLFVRWYANKVLFWGSIAGVAVLIGGIIIFLISKKKKKEEAE